MGLLRCQGVRELVSELSEAGMSTRAIAPIVGAGNKTVARDIAAVSVDTPAPGSEDEPVEAPQPANQNDAPG